MTVEPTELDRLLTEEQSLLKETARQFAQTTIAPRHEHLDHLGTFPEDVVVGMAELGLFGILAPESSGGVGMGLLAHVIAVEEIAAASGAVGAILAVHGAGIGAMQLGSWAGAGEAISRLVAGGSFVAPSFFGAEASTIRAEGPASELSGTVPLCPFPGRAGAYVVRAASEAGDLLCVVIPDGARVSHAGPVANTGLLGFETGPLTLDRAPAIRLGGADAVQAAIALARVSLAALYCGIGRGAVSHATHYAHERTQFDRPLIDFGAIRERLARADAQVEAARGLVHQAARLKDRGERFLQAAARARLASGAAALLATDDGLQVYGGYGYSREYPAERFYRDARFPGVGEGRTADLSLEIARDLG